MFVQRLGADVKLHRARHLLRQVAQLHDEHLHSAVRLTHGRGDSDSADDWQIHIDQDLPAELAPLVGATIHTTRNALDDLAASLVVACGRTPRNTTFPIAMSAHHFAEEESLCLRRATPAARLSVRSVTPWRGADDRLWELHQLDTGGRREPILHLAQSVPRERARVPTALRVLQQSTQPPGARYPLRDKNALTAPVSPGDAGSAAALRSSIHIAFGEGELVRGQPVVDSLEMLITHTERVIDRVAVAAERT